MRYLAEYLVGCGVKVLRMDLERPMARGDASDRLAQRAALMAFLVLAMPTLSGSSGELSEHANVTLRPSVVQSGFLRTPAPEPIGACADGAIDSSEDHHPSCHQLTPPSIRIYGSPTIAETSVRRSTSSELARSHAARGPPSA